MQPEAVGFRTRIFQFAVPGLPELWFGLPIQQVVEVVPLPMVLPVPLAPPHVIGFCQRAAGVIGVIEIARILFPSQVAMPEASATRLLVADVAHQGKRELIGLLISEVAGLKDIPARLPPEPPPHGMVKLESSIVVRFDNRPFVLMDLNRLTVLHQ